MGCGKLDQVLKDICDFLVFKEDFREVLRQNSKAAQSVSAYNFFRVVDELIEMGESILEAGLDVIFVCIFAETAK